MKNIFTKSFILKFYSKEKLTRRPRKTQRRIEVQKKDLKNVGLDFNTWNFRF
jgi:hypothetical protein